MARSKRPSFLKRLKEQARVARAAEKREARQARKVAKTAPAAGDGAGMPDALDVPEEESGEIRETQAPRN